MNPDPAAKTVALFATCLVDLFRPAVGFAAVKLLRDAGYEVEVPEQTCCGQPNFNSGDEDGAREMATRVVSSLSACDYVVTPSGSCAAMLKRQYPHLLRNTPHAQAAEAMAARTWELTAFLTDVAGLDSVAATLETTITYHDACTGLRELGIRQQPRRLLSSVAGLTLSEMQQAEACCGFGGLFCVKYPDVSGRIADAKIDALRETDADYVVTGDVGCLMQIEGRLHRLGAERPRVAHVAEILAGTLEADGHADDE